METFSAIVGGANLGVGNGVGGSGHAASYDPGGAIDFDPAAATRIQIYYWWSPWVLFRSHRDAGVKARVKNMLILCGIVLFYCIVCYILTVITIVTFVKMTEGKFVFFWKRLTHI